MQRGSREQNSQDLMGVSSVHGQGTLLHNEVWLQLEGAADGQEDSGKNARSAAAALTGHFQETDPGIQPGFSRQPAL